MAAEGERAITEAAGVQERRAAAQKAGPAEAGESEDGGGEEESGGGEEEEGGEGEEEEEGGGKFLTTPSTAKNQAAAAADTAWSIPNPPASTAVLAVSAASMKETTKGRAWAGMPGMKKPEPRSMAPEGRE